MAQPKNDTLRGFRAQVARWIARNLPQTPKFKLPQTFMEVETPQQLRYLQDWQRKVYEAGYLGMAWPREYGGGGHEQALQDVVNEELARARAPFMVNAIALMWAGPTLLRLGTEAQKRAYIQKMLSAEEIWCQGFSEPGHGSDLAGVQTRATREGDFYVVNGHKIWTSLGQYAHRMILLARTDPGAASKYDGLTFFLCPMHLPGIEARPIRKMTGEFGFNEVLFRDAAIPADCVVGEEGQGWSVSMAVLTFERGATGGQAGGFTHSVLGGADVVRLARQCRRDGQPASADPVVRDRLVQLLIQERALRLNRARAQNERLLTPEHPLALRLMTKLAQSEFMQELTEFALHLQGSRGGLYLGDPQAPAGGVWQRAYMNSFSSTIGGGTSEVQRNILGERVLGLPKG